MRGNGAEGSERLLAAMREELPALAELMVARTRDEVASFAAVPEREQLEDTRDSVELLMREALGDGPGAVDGDRLAELGRRRAEQGVPIEDLLRAWRLAIQLGTDYARGLAERLALDPQLVIEVFQGALAAADEAMVALAAGHRAAEFEAPPDSRERFVRAALGGELDPAGLRSGATSLGLDPELAYHALRGVGVRAGDLDELGARSLGADAVGAAGLVVSRRGELSGIVPAAPQRARSGLLAVGPAVGLERLPGSSLVADRILAACSSLGLVGVHDLDSAGPHVAIVESNDVGEALLDRIVRPVEVSPSGTELVASAWVWLEAGMRIGPAAKRLHVHANTLRYRLKRLEELAGLDLGTTEDAFSLWWALVRRQAGGRPQPGLDSG